ncbi:DUF4190 domain-containing protein [Amycolatopsis vancoresmycina]|uniref:DUF4190 domain-containing protein n=1 Tax=Amycolatopsis vancoresmycina DSM 44592 TaxID=1292037 RepID=R1G382_9PSEU|nr:DUF4190 domain-containing protein [Amycolatopsis vancoresmycina]EOD65943.1 hypothetical protein H480_23887 [Amycolatopsis vancoresmycina DSM 44592]
MTDPSGDKDRPAADPTAAYDPPPAAETASYEPEKYDPPSGDATIAEATPADTTASTDTPAAADTTVAAEQPGHVPPGAYAPGDLPPGAYETPAAYIPGTPYAPPGQPYPQQPYPPAYGQPYTSPYPQPVPYGQPYAAAPRGQDNALAIGALVCSILGFCSGITALAGLVMGHIALSKTNRGEAGGRGLATAAVIVGYVVVALWVGFVTTLIILSGSGYLDS